MRNPEATRFFSRLLCFVPLLGGLLLVDWLFAQPPVRRVFTHSLDEAAEALVCGKSVWSEVDPLKLKPVWIEHVRTRPEIVVLGSSRSAQIPQDWFGHRTFLNASMFAADLLAEVAIFEKCLETGKTPRLVLLELNPTLKFDDKTRVWPALASSFRHALLRYRIFPPIFFSGPLTLDTVRWDSNLVLGRNLWHVSDVMATGGYLAHPDGSLQWGTTERGASPDVVEREVRMETQNLDPKYRQWRTSSHPDWFDVRILRAFLDDLHTRGIRVVTLLVPIHPIAYEAYHRQGGYDDTWIRKEMAGRGIEVVGAYSPTQVGAGKGDFFDDVHVHAEVLHRLLAENGLAE